MLAQLKNVDLIKKAIKLSFFRLVEYLERQYLWVRLQAWVSSGFGDCEKSPGGMSGGISVCVRAVCKSCVDFANNLGFQHINDSYKKSVMGGAVGGAVI